MSHTCSNRSDSEKIRDGVSELFFLTLICILPPLSMFCDLTLMGMHLPESSITETFQELFLVYAAVTLAISARKHPESRGMLMLMSGLFTCMLIRENDSVFDHVWHGFWFWPAISVALIVISTVFLNYRDRVLSPFLDLVETKIFVYLALGMVVILILSRFYGSGRFVWNTFITGYYSQGIKTAIQEGLELFGYLLLAHGSGMLAHRLNQCKRGHQSS